MQHRAKISRKPLHFFTFSEYIDKRSRIASHNGKNTKDSGNNLFKVWHC